MTAYDRPSLSPSQPPSQSLVLTEIRHAARSAGLVSRPRCRGGHRTDPQIADGVLAAVLGRRTYQQPVESESECEIATVGEGRTSQAASVQARRFGGGGDARGPDRRRVQPRGRPATRTGSRHSSPPC